MLEKEMFITQLFRPKRMLTLKKNKKFSKNVKVCSKMCEKNYRNIIMIRTIVQ